MKLKGYLSTMLQLSANTDGSPEKGQISHSAAIQLKNAIESHWKFKTKEQAQ